MTQSLFISYVQSWFKPIIKSIYETVNGSAEAPKYLHDQFLIKEESIDLKWGSLSSDGSVVMADVVAMDSELPLKKRPSMSKAVGDIPKLGMKKYLNERQLSELSILKKKEGKEASLITKLFADTKSVYVGVKERLEYMFLQALSTGVTSIADAENIGTEVRIDFMVPAGNKSFCSALWSDATNGKPLDDIDAVVETAKAKGHDLAYIFMDKATFGNFKKSNQVKEQWAQDNGFTGTAVIVPNLEKVNDFLSREYGLQIMIIDRTCLVEKNGTQTPVKPWSAGQVTFATSLNLGTLTYGDVAEIENPVSGVSYELVDDFALLSKYRKNDPVREFTSSQAMAVPVLQNVNALYFLNSIATS